MMSGRERVAHSNGVRPVGLILNGRVQKTPVMVADNLRFVQHNARPSEWKSLAGGVMTIKGPTGAIDVTQLPYSDDPWAWHVFGAPGGERVFRSKQQAMDFVEGLLVQSPWETMSNGVKTIRGPSGYIDIRSYPNAENPYAWIVDPFDYGLPEKAFPTVEQAMEYAERLIGGME